MNELTRRNFLATAGAIPAGLAAGDVQAESAPPLLTYSTPAEHIRAFLKLHVSLSTETVYHLYVGTLEAMMPGHEIVNLVSSTTIIRRHVEALPEGHRISIWEGTVYHRPGETEPLKAFKNPLNDRMVRPFHQREGRGEALWTDTGVQFRRHDNSWVSRDNGGKPFSIDWSQAGERIWMSRYSSGVYAKHPLNAKEWPLEFAGPDLLYSEKTTNSGLIREMADPSVLNASATYALTEQQRSEPVVSIAPDEDGIWPWVRHEIDWFYTTAKHVPLETPHPVDQEILCILAGYSGRTVTQREFDRTFATHLTAEMIISPDILPGQLRVLHYNREGGRNGSVFESILMRITSYAPIQKTGSLSELRSLSKQFNLTEVPLAPPGGRAYYIIGYPLSEDDEGKTLVFSEVRVRNHEKFSVVGRFKFDHGILSQNTFDSSTARGCASRTVN